MLKFIAILIVLLVLVAIFVTHPAFKPSPSSIPTEHPSNPSSTSNSASPPTPTIRSWEYGQQNDEMTGKTTKYACLKSSNHLYFDFPYAGGSAGEICLFKSPGHTSANFHIERGQLLCQIDGCTERISINDQPPVALTGQDPADGDLKYVILSPYSRVVQLATRARNFKFQATYFQEGSQVLYFIPDKPLDPGW